MPNYEVHVSFTHVVNVQAASAEAAEAEALAIMENSRGAAFDTREVVQVIACPEHEAWRKVVRLEAAR